MITSQLQSITSKLIMAKTILTTTFQTSLTWVASTLLFQFHELADWIRCQIWPNPSTVLVPKHLGMLPREVNSALAACLNFSRSPWYLWKKAWAAWSPQQRSAQPLCSCFPVGNQCNAMGSILYGNSKKTVADFLALNAVPCPKASQNLQSLPEGKMNFQARKQ